MKYLVWLFCLVVAYAALGILHLLWPIFALFFGWLVLHALVNRCDGNAVFRSMGEFRQREILARLYVARQERYSHPSL